MLQRIDKREIRQILYLVPERKRGSEKNGTYTKLYSFRKTMAQEEQSRSERGNELSL